MKSRVGEAWSRSGDGLGGPGAAHLVTQLSGAGPAQLIATRPRIPPGAQTSSPISIARKLSRRVLAIGSGMQLLNITEGGTLFLHIPEDLPKAIPHKDPIDQSHRHALLVERGSAMERVYGDGEIRVNSMHHMAIDDVAQSFKVTARAPDGVIEAIESAVEGWVAIGTQFHPEAESASALDVKIFEEFVVGITGEVPEMRLVA